MPPREQILATLRQHAPELRAAGLEHLRLFGSVARGGATANSDIDLLADFAPDSQISLLTFCSLQVRLSEILGASVDLSATKWLKEHVSERVLAEAVSAFRGPQQHFADMVRAAALIESFIGTMTFAEDQADPKTIAAVERELLIISEAAYRLHPEDESLCQGPNWTGWRALGNLLRHAYHRIDNESIWDTVKIDVPIVQAAAAETLRTHFPTNA